MRAVTRASQRGSTEGNQARNVKFTETKGNCSVRDVTRVSQRGLTERNQTRNVKLTETKGNCSMRAVMRVVVREAQLKEIKQEILNSQKLKVLIV